MGRQLSEIFGKYGVGAGADMSKTAGENQEDQLNAISLGIAQHIFEKTAAEFQAEENAQLSKVAEEEVFAGFDDSMYMIKEAFEAGFDRKAVASALIEDGFNEEEVIHKVAQTEAFMDKVAEGRLMARGFVAELQKIADNMTMDSSAGTTDKKPEDADKMKGGEMSVSGPTEDKQETFPDPSSADQLDKGNHVSSQGLSALVASAKTMAQSVSGGTKSFTVK